jgi:hypothetical protein
LSDVTYQDVYLGLEGDGVLLLEGLGKLIVKRLLIRDDADLEFHSLITVELNKSSRIT